MLAVKGGRALISGGRLPVSAAAARVLVAGSGREVCGAPSPHSISIASMAAALAFVAIAEETDSGLASVSGGGSQATRPRHVRPDGRRAAESKGLQPVVALSALAISGAVGRAASR